MCSKFMIPVSSKVTAVILLLLISSMDGAPLRDLAYTGNFYRDLSLEPSDRVFLPSINDPSEAVSFINFDEPAESTGIMLPENQAQKEDSFMQIQSENILDESMNLDSASQEKESFEVNTEKPAMDLVLRGVFLLGVPNETLQNSELDQDVEGSDSSESSEDSDGFCEGPDCGTSNLSHDDQNFSEQAVGVKSELHLDMEFCLKLLKIMALNETSVTGTDYDSVFFNDIELELAKTELIPKCKVSLDFLLLPVRQNENNEAEPASAPTPVDYNMDPFDGEYIFNEQEPRKTDTIAFEQIAFEDIKADESNDGKDQNVVNLSTEQEVTSGGAVAVAASEDEVPVIVEYEFSDKYRINPLILLPLLCASITILYCIFGMAYSKHFGPMENTGKILKVPRMGVFSNFPNVNALPPAMKAEMMNMDKSHKNNIFTIA